jgi:hypothetical protein
MSRARGLIGKGGPYTSQEHISLGQVREQAGKRQSSDARARFSVFSKKPFFSHAWSPVRAVQ